MFLAFLLNKVVINNGSAVTPITQDTYGHRCVLNVVKNLTNNCNEILGTLR